MSRRRLRVVYSSSDDEDDTNSNSEPQHQIQNPNFLRQDNDDDDEIFDEPLQQQQLEEDEEEEEIEIPSQDPIPNIESVTLDSSIATATVDEDFIDVSDNLSPPSPPEEEQPVAEEQPLPAQEPVEMEVGSDFVASDCAVNDWLRRMGLWLRREWLDSCKLGLESTVPGFASFDVETKAKLCFGQFLVSDMNYVGAGVLPPNVHEMHLVDLAGPYVLQVDEVINISRPLKERYKNAPYGIKRCLKLSMTDGVQRVFGMEYRPVPSKILEALGPAGFKVVIRNVNVRRGLLMLVPEVLEVLGGSVEELEAARTRLIHEVNKPPRGKRTRTGVVPPLSTRATLAAWPQNGVSNDPVQLDSADRVPRNNPSSTFGATPQFHENVQGADTLSRNIHAHPTGRETTEDHTVGQINQHSTSVSAQRPFSRGAAQHSTCIETAELPTSGEATEPPPRRESTELSSFSTTIIENEDTHMVDHVEHPFLLSEGMELPFTYLASISAKWVTVQENEPFVRGKIKCFMTGVKGFQYRQRSTFELRVYVDDGSLISEILVHHNLVQKEIGYSPEELTTALCSSDQNIVDGMKATLRKFQSFLVNFEGIMIVEMNETSTVPVALEMKQGCHASDAWLLLQRLKPVPSNQFCQNDQSNVINLSP